MVNNNLCAELAGSKQKMRIGDIANDTYIYSSKDTYNSARRWFIKVAFILLC